MLRVAVLLMLVATAGLFANRLVPQWRSYRHGGEEAEGVGTSVAPPYAEVTASAPERDATAVLDDRLHEAELCVKGSATLQRFTYDATQQVASMHINLREPEALSALLDCLEANTAGTDRWTLSSYEALDGAATGGSVQRSGQIVLTSAPQ
ncbi:hypothetical protein ACG04R_18895 [Roseateles sp. BYS78W]|uniref:Uncharacterized protein n=1 Tax=Pelomonas candidula TaxID=3299025 RepID=A0ABW7HFS5_9BURK